MTVASRYVHMNGTLVPYADAVVHVQSCAVKYGTAVFEGIRGYWNQAREELYLFRLRDHVDRLFVSLRLLRMEHGFSHADVVRAIVDTIRANEFREDVYSRVTAYLAIDGELDAPGPVGIAIDVRPRRLTAKSAISAGISTWARLSDRSMPPRIKATANYQNARLATIEARLAGYDSALLLNEHGKLAEAPAACCFIVRDGVVITPPIQAGILESITRRTIIEVLPDLLHRTVQEREIDRTELYVADEIFVCGTAWEVMPVVSIDRMDVGTGRPGPVSAAIQAEYARLVRGQVRERQDWLTPVWNADRALASPEVVGR
jgi:branched-chain amino acid aminotransferase